MKTAIMCQRNSRKSDPDNQIEITMISISALERKQAQTKTIYIRRGMHYIVTNNNRKSNCHAQTYSLRNSLKKVKKKVSKQQWQR